MQINIEILTYTILAVGVVTELLKRNNLNTNILATVATVLGAVVFIGLSGFSVPNIIVGAVIGAASSGFYDLGKGISSAIDLGGKLNSKDESTGGE